jgi:heme oxygenase
MDLSSSGRVWLPTMTVRQRLRDGLAQLHGRLDARITAACLSPRADLRRLLAVHAMALPPVVAGLRSAGAAKLWPEWDDPARLATLAAEAGVPPFRAEASPAEAFDNEARAWGGLYALLGSRLGNRVVLRRLAEAGEPADSAFLRHGAGDGPGWRRFLDRLEGALGPATAGADATFRDAIEGAASVMGRYLDAVERLGDRAAARIGEACH